MKLTNKLGLPEAIVRAVANDSYEPGHGDMSITTLIDSPRIAVLSRQYREEIEEDAADRIFSLLGQSIHEILRRANSSGIVEKRLYADIEGWKISGQFDRIEYFKDYGLLSDYKVTCVPLEAEILTRNGWKKYNELIIGEEVLSYDSIKDVTTWTPLLDIYKSDNNEIWHLKSKSFDFECTPNHGWFVQKCSSKYNDNKEQRHFVKNKKGILISNGLKPIYSKDSFRVETQNFKVGDRIIAAAYCNDQGLIDINEEEAALLGWLLTDGHIRFNARFISAQLYQSKEPYVTEIRNRFKNWFTSEGKRTGKTWKKPLSIFYISTSKLKILLRKAKLTCKEDFPSFVTKLSITSRKALLESMIKAEGYIKDGKLKHFCQNPGPILDGFQILMTLEGQRLGLACGARQHKAVLTVPLRTRYVSAFSRKTFKPIWKDQNVKFDSVWCPVTKYESFVCRYKKQITITGNSLWAVKYGLKESYIKQLNAYRYLAEKNGYSIQALEIVSILRDWRKNESLITEDYPEHQIKILPVPLWSMEDTEKYLIERVRAHQQAREILPNCSDEDTWRTKDKWALMKKGSKRAIKLYEFSEMAHLAAKKDDKHYVEFRKGKPVRCADGWCSLAPICTQWQEEKKRILLEKINPELSSVVREE